MDMSTGRTKFLYWCDRFVTKYVDERNGGSHQNCNSVGPDRAVHGAEAHPRTSMQDAYRRNKRESNLQDGETDASDRPRHRDRSCLRVRFADPLVRARYCPKFCITQELDAHVTFDVGRHGPLSLVNETSERHDDVDEDVVQVLFAYVCGQARAFWGFDKEGCISSNEALLCSLGDCLFESKAAKLPFEDCFQQEACSTSGNIDKSGLDSV
ncbi:hypothetical protein GUITHDRAFT_152451 [Guillardia theta CCMP2712]|uniref:Uncharacterized protein n=2 Tax=Guillardia theta TaxID=55529 RepID=L1JDD3_GUITC|nr:hypothetical protein GUITHDRAFT_152451 [Guillardia theta CCMP2712]EKX46282.1 hypothetical protein GUITHDRAFT_152451 [Guillardia theta CCMP2712]|eukprot:XP_005833262.1 hypothetical protein GUITHDRAFT_152451 [Guillardia theta CCMP2712]